MDWIHSLAAGVRDVPISPDGQRAAPPMETSLSLIFVWRMPLIQTASYPNEQNKFRFLAPLLRSLDQGE
jgi:hypothetical protein